MTHDKDSHMQDPIRELAPDEFEQVTGGFVFHSGNGNVGNGLVGQFNGFSNLGIISDSFGHRNFP